MRAYHYDFIFRCFNDDFHIYKNINKKISKTFFSEKPGLLFLQDKKKPDFILVLDRVWGVGDIRGLGYLKLREYFIIIIKEKKFKYSKSI